MVGVKDTASKVVVLRKLRLLRTRPTLTIQQKGDAIKQILTSDRETFKILAKK